MVNGSASAVSPDALTQLAAIAVRVTLAEGEKKTQALKISGAGHD